MDWFGLVFDATLPGTVLSFLADCLIAGLVTGGLLAVLGSVES